MEKKLIVTKDVLLPEIVYGEGTQVFIYEDDARQEYVIKQGQAVKKDGRDKHET